MILHRLRLTNFRGVADREIVFPESGVVVVCGPNEVGKSSMLEALDLLLEYKDRSSNQKVKQVKPTHADVGAEVEAEISTGPYRFVYRKRFHKKCLTELTVIAPARRQHTGDEAHEQVQAMVAETVDARLWEAQRVLQSATAAPVDLSGCDALARALDTAAGEVVAANGVESLLIDRIDAEFERYYTPAAGKPTREFKEAIDRLNAAERNALRCREAVAEVEDRMSRHAELSALSRELAEALGPAAQRLSTARSAQQAVAELAGQLAQARLVATAAAATSVSSTLANEQRQQLVADVQRRVAALAELRSGLAAAEQEAALARRAAQDTAQISDQAEGALHTAQRRLDNAKATAEACIAGEEAARLATRLQRIDETGQRLSELSRQLTSLTITDELLADIDQQSALVDRLRAQLDADVGTVEFTAQADLDISIDGTPRTVIAGEVWSLPASVPVSVQVAGVLGVRIDPGAAAVKLRSDLSSAERDLERALENVGASDIAVARAQNDRRRELAATCAQLSVRLDDLRDGDAVDGLRSRLAELLAAQAAAGAQAIDVEAAISELAAADGELNAARTEATARQRAAVEANATLAGKDTQLTVLAERMNSAQQELAAVEDQLDLVRAEVSDEVLATQAAVADEARTRAEHEVSDLAQRYEAADPDGVGAELAAAEEAAECIDRDHQAAKRALHDLTVELGVIGSEGREGQLSEAEAELDWARREHDRIAERAAAAKMLRDTMTRHREIARGRYVQPYRNELERLGRVVFGDSFEVEVDTALSIVARTLGGRTVPYESLSGGAREQLGILARLAGAALVAEADAVPVVIDDALGFSDSDRLAKMGAVFNTVGGRGQVIVLTCQPMRYADVSDAKIIELSA